MTHIKSLPARTVKRLLRDAGHNYSTVAARRQKKPSLVSRVVRREAVSALIWEDVVWALNHPLAQGGDK